MDNLIADLLAAVGVLLVLVLIAHVADVVWAGGALGAVFIYLGWQVHT